MRSVTRTTQHSVFRNRYQVQPSPWVPWYFAGAAASGLEVSRFDSITVAESVTAVILVSIDVSDVVTVAESVPVDVSGPAINVTDSVAITEFAPVAVSGPAINTVDSVTVAESVPVLMSSQVIDVTDSISVAESTPVAVSGPAVDVTDSISVAEDVDRNIGDTVLLIDVDVFDSVTTVEFIATQIIDYRIQVFVQTEGVNEINAESFGTNMITAETES